MFSFEELEKADHTDVIKMYLAARVDLAEREYAIARRHHAVMPMEYTSARLQWCKNQLAAIKIVERDADSWYRIVEKYLKRLEDEKCQLNQLPGEQSTIPTDE